VKNYDIYCPANVSVPYDVASKNYKIVIILVIHFSTSYLLVKIQTMLTLSDTTSFMAGVSPEFKPHFWHLSKNVAVSDSKQLEG
jgi:hypothetical protein